MTHHRCKSAIGADLFIAQLDRILELLIARPKIVSHPAIAPHLRAFDGAVDAQLITSTLAMFVPLVASVQRTHGLRVRAAVRSFHRTERSARRVLLKLERGCRG